MVIGPGLDLAHFLLVAPALQLEKSLGFGSGRQNRNCGRSKVCPLRCSQEPSPEAGQLGDVGSGDHKSSPKVGASITWTVVTCLPGGERALIATPLDFSREAGDAVFTCKSLKQRTTNSNKYFYTMLWETHTHVHTCAGQTWATRHALVVSVVGRDHVGCEGKGIRDAALIREREGGGERERERETEAALGGCGGADRGFCVRAIPGK